MGVSNRFNEYQNDQFFIRHEVDGRDGNVTSERKIQIDPLEGLDRNEIAEIVAMEFTANLSSRDGVDANSELSNLRADISFSVNQVADFQTDEQDVRTEVLEDDSGAETALDAQVGSDTNLLYYFNLEANAGYRNSTDGNGGPGSIHGPLSETKNFRDLLGGGPVLDRFDEIVVRHQIRSDDYTGIAVSEVKGQFYYVTEEEEDSRGTSF